MIRVVYLHGIRGTGKTLFSLLLAPEAEVGFVTSPVPVHPIEGFPWPAGRCVEGDPVFPGEFLPEGGPRSHDFSQRDTYRDLAGIPAGARVARVSGDGFMWLTKAMGADDRVRTLRAVQARVLEDFDVVVHDMAPQEAPRDDERVIFLAAPAQAVQARSELPCWGGRGPFNLGQFREAARQVLDHRGRLWPGRYDSLCYWWHEEAGWLPIEDAARRAIADLGFWYHYAELAGVPVAPPQSVNGEAKWRRLRACMPESLVGLRVLDVGANAGFNSLRAADEGATVVAFEADDRYRRQYEAVVAMGPRPPGVTDRIEFRSEPVQTVRLSRDRFDVALLSAVHYHINRSGIPIARWPKVGDEVPHLREGLAIVLEDLAQCADLVVVATNTAHAEREKDPFVEATVDWLLEVLPRLGFRDVEERPGEPGCPLVVARGRGEAVADADNAVTVGPSPPHLTFYLGWECNARCVMCWQDVARKGMERPWPQLSFDHFAAVLNRYERARSLELCSFGEPMAHPEFGRMLDFLLRDGRSWQQVNVVTNGSLLDRFAGELGQLPGQLTVSIDSPDPSTYAAIRKGLRLGRVVENIRDFQRRRSHERRIVGVNMVLLRRNVDQVERMAELADDLDLRYLAILRGDALSLTEVPDEGLPADHEGVRDAVERVRVRFPRLDIFDHFSAEQTGRVRRPEGHCILPWSSLDVGPSGSAHPCCRSHSLNLGDAIDGDPWHHPDLVDLRRQLRDDALDADRFPDCAACPLLRG